MDSQIGGTVSLTDEPCFRPQGNRSTADPCLLEPVFHPGTVGLATMAKAKPTRRTIALSLMKDGDSVPTEFRIFAMGINPSEKGDFLFDDLSAASVMAEYERHGKPLMMDYNHGVTFPNPTAEQAKASAKSFVPEVRADGLWATKVEWTDQAREYLSSGEYRMFSPLFEHDPKTNRVLRLINVALTNLPALDGIEPIAASANGGDTTMTEQEIKDLLAKVAALETSVKAKDQQIATLEGKTITVALATTVGLAATAADTDVRTAVASLAAFRKQVLDVLEKKDEATAIGALSALKEKAGEAAALTAKIAEIETSALSAEWKTYLDGLSTVGKDGKFLEPAKREKAEKMALTIGGGALTRKGIDGAKEYVVEMLTAKTGGAFTPTAGGGQVSALQAQVFTQMGIKPDDFAKAAAGGR